MGLSPYSAGGLRNWGGLLFLYICRFAFSDWRREAPKFSGSGECIAAYITWKATVCNKIQMDLRKGTRALALLNQRFLRKDSPMTQIDFQILDWVQQHFRCGFLDVITPLITALGEFGAVWVLLALVLLIRKKTRPMGLAVTAALVLDVLLCNALLKPLVNRPRPFTLRPETVLLVKAPRDASFPSGHAAASFAAAAALWGTKSRLRIPAMALAAAVSLTRIYLYVHYPSDVLCGAILGSLCGIAGVFAVKWWSNFCKSREI